MENSIQNITVLGAGTMGSAIAEFFAAAGHPVALYSRTEETLVRARAVMAADLAMLAEVDGPREAADTVLSRVRCFTDLAQASAEADWVIETVAEDAQVKKAVLEAADCAAPLHAYLTSDTSALNIFSFLETGRPERVLITHFFNPASLMPLVEMVPGPQTSADAVRKLRAFLESLGKQPILLRECIPGFLANRLTLALAREAFYLAGEGYASIEDIDRVITSTFGPRYVFEGIFDLYDHIGMDVGCAVAKDLLPELCSDTQVPRLLREKREAGELGVKTGKGLKDYTGQDIPALRRERNRKIAKSLRQIRSL